MFYLLFSFIALFGYQVPMTAGADSNKTNKREYLAAQLWWIRERTSMQMLDSSQRFKFVRPMVWLLNSFRIILQIGSSNLFLKLMWELLVFYWLALTLLGSPCTFYLWGIKGAVLPSDGCIFLCWWYVT